MSEAPFQVDGMNHVLCPMCHYYLPGELQEMQDDPDHNAGHYVNIVGICVDPYGSELSKLNVRPTGIQPTPRERMAGDTTRGHTITMSFECEHGHAWEVQYHFHKGQTDAKFVKKENVAKLSPTFWRN